MRARSGGVVIATGAVIALTVLGCASSPPVSATVPAHATPERVFVGNQGGAWEAVLPPQPQEVHASADEFTRRDAALNVNEPESVLTMGLWPEPYRPSLDETRQLFLINRPGYITYFSQYQFYAPAYHARGVYLWP